MAIAVASGDIDYAVTAISGGLISLAEKGAVKVIGGALSEEPGIDGQNFLFLIRSIKQEFEAQKILMEKGML